MSDLATRIDSQASMLSPAQRRVAEVVLGDPSAAAFATVAEVAERAGTSGATVVRLADRLGYDGWVELQADARAQIDRRLRPATERIREARRRADVLTATAEREAENVHQTLAAVDSAEFARAVDLLADPHRTIRVLAGTAQDGIGRLLADGLALLRPGVERVAGSPVRVAERLAHVESGDVLVVIDLRRYERWVVGAAELAARRGPVLAVTDSRLSPLALAAAIAFTVTAEGAGPFDSHVGTLALVNALLTGVASRRRRSATRRLDRIEAAWADADALVER